MTPLRRRMIEDMTLRNLRPTNHRGLRRARRHLREVLPHLTQASGPEHIRGYLLHLVQERHVSWSYYNQTVAALAVPLPGHPGQGLGRSRCRCSQAAPEAPVVLSLEEIARFLARSPDSSIGPSS